MVTEETHEMFTPEMRDLVIAGAHDRAPRKRRARNDEVFKQVAAEQAAFWLGALQKVTGDIGETEALVTAALSDPPGMEPLFSRSEAVAPAPAKREARVLAIA